MLPVPVEVIWRAELAYRPWIAVLRQMLTLGMGRMATDIMGRCFREGA